MSEEIITTAPVAEGQASAEPNPWQMDMGDLAKAAGIDGTTPALQPQSVEPTPQAQPQALPDAPYTLAQENGSFVLKYKTGEVFKGANEMEVFRKAAENAVRTTEWARTVKAQYDQFQQNPNQPVQMPNEPTTPEQEAQAAMLQAQAVREFFMKDVVTPELSASIVANALGVPVDQLPQVLEQYQSTFQDNYQRNQLRDFHASCPEYADLPEQADALASTLVEMHGGQVPPNYVPSAQDLRLAWAMALHEGKAQPYIHRTPPPAPKFPVMPTVNAASQSLTGGQDVWSMPLDQLATLAGITHK